MFTINAVQFIRNAINKESVKQILEQYGARHIAEQENAFRSTCPIHGGDNPTSFVWNYSNGLWFCFTECGTGGDIFDFVADVNDLSIEHEFRTIVVKAAELLNLDISNLEMGEAADRNQRELQAFLDYASRGEREINPPYDINRLGRFFKLNSFRNLTQDTLETFKIRYSESYNRIAVPMYNEENILVGVSLRKTNQIDEPKWIHRPKHINTRYLLYGLNLVDPNEGSIFITEGAFDVANVRQLGISNIVATFGSHLADEQVDIILKRFLIVYLCYDNDKAGNIATKKAIEKLKNKVDLYVLDWSNMPDIHDLGEIQNKEDILNNLIPYYKYIKE